MQTYLDLHRQTGVRFSWGLVSGGTDLEKLIVTARQLAAADALLAFEGNNEPNNWGVTYQGEQGGGRAPSWLAVAKLQRDLYKAVKSDPLLKKYPVWSISEAGAEADNVGLQFLTIPAGAGAKLPDGTRFADFVNVHNYIYHPNSARVEDNKTWNAADPTSACKIDGLYGNHGVTWAKHFRGYSQAELLTLPRVTTETGCTIDGSDHRGDPGAQPAEHVSRSVQAGLEPHGRLPAARPNGRRRQSKFRILQARRLAAEGRPVSAQSHDDSGGPRHDSRTGQAGYSIPGEPATVHDLLLQKSDGTFELVVWDERVKGDDRVRVNLGSVRPSVKVYDPTVGTAATRVLHDVASVELTLSDHPVILETKSQ